MNTTRKERFIQKATRLAVKVLLFSLLLSLFLYAGVGTDSALIPDDMLDASIEPGIAQAEDASSTAVDIGSFADYPDVTSVDLTAWRPDYYKSRGRYSSTDADNGTAGTWNSNTWTMGAGKYHSGTDYANVWFDFDLGDWKKYSESLKITVTGTVSRDSIDGYIFVLMSSDTAYGDLDGNYFDPYRDNTGISFNGTAGGGGSEKTMDGSHTSDTYKRFTGSLNISHNISGRYVRIALCSWDGNGWYEAVTVKDVSIVLTRTLKSYTINYNKNASDATGTVSATSHKFMEASNVSSSTFARPGYYQSGWNTASNGTGAQLNLGESTGTDATTGLGLAVKNALAASTTSITLYATWSPAQYTVNIDTNGDGTKDDTKTWTYNTSYKLDTPTHTNPSLIFAGWIVSGADVNYSTAKYGSTSSPSPSTAIGAETVCFVASGTYFLNLSTTHQGTVTITAKWTTGDFGILNNGITISMPSNFDFAGNSVTYSNVTVNNSALWGSRENPFVISDKEQFNNLAKIANGAMTPVNTVTGASIKDVTTQATDVYFAGCYFIVANSDGTAVTIDWDSAGIMQIGKHHTTPFLGYIVGNGSEITNFTASDKTAWDNAGIVDGNYHPGLFGYVGGNFYLGKLSVSGSYSSSGGDYSSGVVSEVCGSSTAIIDGVTSDVDVIGANYTGGIVGILHAGLVLNCTNKGSITATEGDSVGGVVGRANNQAKIIGCSNTGDVTGKTYVGGILGSSYNGSSNVTITNASNSGEVYATGDYAGGILGGTQTNSTATISGTLTNNGGVAGTNYVGGIVGRWYASSSTEVEWTATINVTHTTLPHGIVISGASYVGGAIGMLSSNITITGSITFSTGNVDGKVAPGTSDGPQAGAVIGGIVGYNAGVITADMAFNGGRVLHRGGGLSTPDAETLLGDYFTEATAFLGGIVGYNAGTIKNATKAGSQDTLSFENASLYVGGIAGFNSGTIENCHYTTSSSNGLGYHTALSGRSQYVGGIAGYSSGNITSCSATSSSMYIYGSSYVGGIVGHATGSAVLTDIMADAVVNGTSHVGGYIGYYDSTAALTISDKTHTKSTTGSGDHVGGFVGRTNSEAKKIFKNLTNSGDVTGGNYTGGIVGRIHHANGGGNNRFITCVNTGSVTGAGHVGGITGYTRDAWYYGCINGSSDAVNETTITGSGTRVGGIVGGFDGGTITSSSTSGDYAGSVARNSANYMEVVCTGTTDAVGGIVGYANWVSGSVNNSDNYGNVTATNGSKVGGVVGYFSQGSAGSRYDLTNCTNSGSVTGVNYVGGIVGHAYTKNLSACSSTGNVTATGNYVGGVAGYVDGIEETTNSTTGVTTYAYANVSNISATGSVTGVSYVGGFIGLYESLSGGTLSVSDKTRSANVTATGDYVGGFFGQINTEGTVTLTNLTNSANITGVSNVGGVIGYSNAGTLTNMTTSGEILGSGDYVGGIVGHLDGGTVSGEIKSTAYVKGATCVGGLFGAWTLSANADATLSYTNAGGTSPWGDGNNVDGTLGVGGIAGYIDGQNNEITGSISVSGDIDSGTGGGFIGGIAGAAENVTINPTSASAVSAAVFARGSQTYDGITGGVVGGLVGYLKNSTISKLSYTGGNVISVGGSAPYCGGAVGYASGSTISNVYVSTKVGNNGLGPFPNDYTGGIVGNLVGGEVSNCVYRTTDNTWGINGAQYVGGIAGYNSGGTISNTYCLDGTKVVGTSNVGGVVGESTVVISSSVAFYNNVQVKTSSHNNTGSSNKYGSYVVNSVNVAILPLVDSTKYTWEDITTQDFTGFYFETISTNNGYYLSLEKLDSTGDILGHAKYSDELTISTTHSGTGVCTFTDINYLSTFGQYAENIRVIIREIKYATPADMVYDGTDKANEDGYAWISDVSDDNYKNGYSFDIEVIAGDTINVTNDGYDYEAHINYDGKVFGCKTDTAKIDPFNIESDECYIFYDGAVYGNSNTFPGNNTLIDVTSFKDNLGVIQYEEGKTFYIYRKYSGYNTPGNFRLLCTVTLAFDGATKTAGQNTVSASDKGILTVVTENVVIDPYTKVDEDVESYFTTDNNYTGTLTLNYMVVDSDYGVLESADHSKQWGSAENPYVISHWIHLLRLSEIVNGLSKPVNSVNGMGINRDSNVANTVSNSIAYSAHQGGQSHFVVTENITIPEHIEFFPIGGYGGDEGKYFGGIFDGSTARYANINLGNHFASLTSNYVGLFGVVKGNADGRAELIDFTVTSNRINGGNFVGSMVGKADSYVYISVESIDNGYQNGNVINGANCVGGVVGYVGLGVEMYGEFVNNAKVSGSSYVGGVIGQIMAGAGRQGTGANAGTYYLGEYTVDGVKHASSMTNYGSVVGSQAYTGGVIGAMTQNAAPYDGVITVFEPTFIRNEANVTGQTVVGGLVGRIELNNAIRLINTEDEGQANWSYNGSIDSTTYEITTNTSYAGGLFGTLSTMGHQIESVFSTAVVKTSVGSSSNEGNYIGGLVGYMNGGTFRYSFVSLPGNQTVNTTTDMVRGNNYVGGLVGNMALGTLDTCYVQGFKYDNNLTTARGGVAGVAATVATIKDTWALYLTADPTYQSVPANAYGNYILSFYSASDGAMNAYIDEMFVFAGLIPNSAVSRAHATGSAGEIEAKKGSISLGITLPSVGTITGYDQKAQVVFYDGSGYEDPFEHAFEAAANDSNEQNLFLRLSASTEGSVIIAKTSVRFGSISNYTNSTAWEEKYLYIGKTGLYKIDVVDHPTDDGNYHRGSYQTSYSFDYSATGNYVKTSRDLTFQYAKYSAVAPRIIASQADWDAFASEVRTTSNANGLSQYVKLATNAVQVNYNNLAGDINATIDANGAIVGKHFAGTFDGDGHYITVNIDATGQSKNNEIGLFPHAANATFQNLTIKGSITTVGDDVGAFVGIARGDLIFENCTNEANITSTKAGDNNLGAHNIGGLVGTSYVFNIAFIDCVNTGDVTASNGNVAASANDSTYGVGGIIGQGASTSKVIVLDSCRNSGNITAVKNVGGMIGFAYTKTIVTNCGNSGTIKATNGNNSVVNDSNSNVGGIIGITDENGSIDVFASYNSGDVIGWGNKAGGIMGADCDYTSSSRQSKIYNCYNTGNIYTGGNNGVTTGGTVGESTGVQVGGIFGNGLYVDVAYCYNLGTITCNGIAGEALYWSNRAGGIGGYTQTTSECKISFCYNAGRIIVNDDSNCNNVGAILGHSKDADAVKAVYDSNGKMIGGLYTCYTIQNACHWPHGGNDKQLNFNARTNHDKWTEGVTSYSNNEIQNETAYSGIVVDTIADLTAVMNANGTTMVVNSNDGRTVSDTHSNSDTTFTKTIDLDGDFSARGNVQSLAEMQDLSRDMVSYATSGNWNSILSVLNNNYEGYSSLLGGGYVWVYGCLPQLAVFAVDTRNGLAMSSRSFDKDNQGIYAIREAGSEFNPYIVKDGIDLMGINAILQADKGGVAYDFDGEYISFANSTNNLEKDVTTYINLPDTAQFGGSHENTTYGQTYVTPDSAKCFMFSNGTSLEGGKSYHLFEKGAVIADNFVGSLGDQYGNWISKNGGVKLNDQNMIPIGTYRPFAGNLSGALTYDAENNVSSQTEIRGINITFPDAGLFGGVSNGSVKYITLTGTIKASNSGNTATAGIVAKATNNAQIVGVKSGTTDRILSISTTAGTYGYTGGIVGMADSGASGNRLTIANSVVVNATITGFKDSIGGIVGYSEGDDAASFTDIVGCHVQKATVQSSSTGTKRLIGGIVGAQGATGALTVSGCHVGTEGASGTNVTIKGDHSFGGIISFADAGAGCANAFIDCYVWGDVLIQRQNPTNDSTYGTAIGGIVGYVSDDASGYATFRGEIEFHGTINVSDFANVQNVGGVVGYMGSSARMEQCFVTVAGTINAERCSNADSIGGFAGISKGVALDGIFTIAPSLLTDTADNVGGFIGLNDGDTYITRTTTIETGGQIEARYNVGGFIGANSEGSELHMGAAEYKGTVYGEDGDSATISLHASVDGKKYVGGFLGYNKGDVFGEYCTVINNGKVGANDHSKGTEDESIDCIGGVFGDNSTGGTISISENAVFVNNGQVGHSDFENAYQEFVGGVLGVALGDITNNGVMRNTGDVYGYEYVGGAIGGLVNGTISGQLANGDDVMPLANADSEALVASDEALSTADTGSSSVTAVVNVGGVIGIVMQNAIIDGAIMYNYGHVESSGDEYEVSNLGGAIGLNYGVIQNGAQFYNYGTITAKNFAGGALGVSDGVIRDSNFYNYATITFTGDTALGGSVGYITNNYTSHGTAAYYPTNNAALGTYDSDINRSQVTGSYFGYESNGDNKVVLQATGEHPYPLNTILSELGDNKMSAFVAKGGLGGVFGAINSDYMTEEGGWSGNTFFIYGDVYGGVFLDGNTNNFTPENFGGTVDAVGGVIGAIEVSHISISNMLIYKSNVGGKDYVGGIVGYNDNSNEITGAGAAIDNCYNVYGEVIGTTYNGGAISASYKHVGGIVGFVPSSTDPGLINDSSDYNKPVTNASYWIKSYSNEHLQNSNPQDIVNTLDKASTWTEFLSHADYINNNDPYYQVDDEGNVVNEGKLAEGQTWDEYFAIHTQYVQNANEDWGTYQDVTINYNTGVKATGFYYIFAEAEEGNAQFEYAKEAIQVEHSNAEAPLTSPYTNDESLNFWLIIANSAGQSVKSYKSDQVASYVNDGNVVPGYIYSTAFNSNKNGYYLYVSDESTGRAATSLYAGTTDANGNTQVYVSSDASTAGNVMIFYKEAVMLSYLNYNGYERYAPIADVTYKQDMTGGVYGTNYYSFTNDVDGDTINTGREAGSYDVQASIYTVDKVGTVITLGKLDSTLADGEDYKWNIRKRTLEVEFETGDIGETGEDKNLWNRYDGTFSHYIKFTVTNFAKDEHISEAQVYEAINDMMALKYSFNGSSSTETIDAIYDSWNFLSGSVIPDSTGFDESVTHIAYYRTDYDGSSAKPGDKSNTIVDGTYSELGSLQIYKADYIVFVKKAGKHTVKVEVAGTEKNHSSPKKNSKDYNVDMRDLILDFTYSKGSSLLPTYEFDGGMEWQGIQSVVISGFLVGDALKDNITTVGSTASLLNGDGKADKDNIVANDNNTVTVNFFANNAGTYNAHIEISEAIRNNYRFVKQSDAGFPGSLSPSTNSYEWDASWTINKYVITLENLKITSDQELIYNGREQSPTFSGEGGADFVKEHGNETITIFCDASVTNGSGVTKAVNVDTYTINVAASGSGGGSGTVEGENSLATNGINNYQINYTLDSSQEQDVTFKIVPREIRLVWNNPNLSYVYSGNAQGLSINDLTFEMKNDEGTWAEYKDAKLSVENGKIKVSNVFAYDGKSETLYFSFSDFTAEDAGSYTAKVTGFDSVSGTNDAGSAEKGNYSESLPNNKTYNIAKSKIVVAYNNNTNLDKTFDNTSTVKANLGSVSLSSQNGGATAVKVTLSNAFFCDNSGNAVVNVGNGYSIKVNMSLSDTKNYEFVGASTQVFNVGAKITPAPLTITLNNSSSGANTVYKTFDNSDIYAVVESNGTNRVSSTGTQFRTGRGITVDGFFTDGVTVTATFAEIDGNRAWASKYVNNVIRTVSTPYVYTMSDEDFYKKLHIVLSSEGGESNNYYIAAVKNKSGTTILTQSSGQYIDVMDSRAEGSNTNGDNIKIAITKYSLKATYSNTAQSYANPDNSYNLDWLEVDGTLRIPSSWGLSSSDLDVDVANGWMYVNGTSGEKKQYEQYTRIAGSASSTRLGAVLSSDDGYDLCVTLRNQPTLVIGYFVSKDGEEIGTMAGLLIATEYFKNNFNAEGAKGYDFTQTPVPLSALNSNNVPADVFAKINSGDINTWEELIEAVPEFNVAGYTFNEDTYDPINLYYDMSSDIKVLEEKLNKTEQEQAYLDALISQRDSFELTYVALTEGGEETLQYVYWKAEEISENLSFKSFVLVDNIDAILTEEDMDMLKGAFGTNWGVGKTYLTNVLFAEVGSVVIFNGPVFDYTTDAENKTVAFDGVFDGAGYSIDHLTIMYSAQGEGEHNVGMFAEVSGTGSQVTAINLRNLNIQVIDTTASAKVINVGGVAGKFAASTVMEDVTVHGTISVKSTLGTVHAGGVIGSDSTGYIDGGVSKVIDGAIVVATVRAEGAIAVAGGVIGIMNEVNTTLTDVVSLSEVYAKGASTYANGFVGQYAKLVDGSASYDQDGIDYAPLNSTGKTSAYMNSVFEITVDGTYTRIAGGVSYDTLYDGSSTAYVDGIYLNAIEVSYGTYDMVGEKNAISGKNTTGSMRLRDIVDTYVLGYELSAYTSGTGESAIATYRKSTTSKYVGTADGTADNRIGIAYQQHLNLIRMFNYMNFTLNRNVTMYTGYELRVIDEAFTGTIEANGHEVNVRSSESNKDFEDDDDDDTTYPQFFAYQDVNFTWLKKD